MNRLLAFALLVAGVALGVGAYYAQINALNSPHAAAQVAVGWAYLVAGLIAWDRTATRDKSARSRRCRLESRSPGRSDPATDLPSRRAAGSARRRVPCVQKAGYVRIHRGEEDCSDWETRRPLESSQSPL